MWKLISKRIFRNSRNFDVAFINIDIDKDVNILQVASHFSFDTKHFIAHRKQIEYYVKKNRLGNCWIGKTVS